MLPQSTPQIKVLGSQVALENGTLAVPNVLQSSGVSLELFVGLQFDPSLWGKGFLFDCNFQVLQVGDNSIASNNWWTGAWGGGYPFFLDIFQMWGWVNDNTVWIGLVNTASNFGVNDGLGNQAEDSNTGMYNFRPYCLVDTGSYPNGFGGNGFEDLLTSFGTSQFGVADDLFFFCE